MQEFEKELEQIDTKYPFSMPTSLQLSVQIIVGIFFIIVIVIGLWLYCKHRSHLQGLWQLPLKVPDILQCDLGPITKLFSQNNSSNIIEPPIPPPIHVQPTTSTLHPSYCATDMHTPKPLQPVSLSSLSLHSEDFNITLLDEITKPSLNRLNRLNSPKRSPHWTMSSKQPGSSINRTKFLGDSTRSTWNRNRKPQEMMPLHQ